TSDLFLIVVIRRQREPREHRHDEPQQRDQAQRFTERIPRPTITCSSEKSGRPHGRHLSGDEADVRRPN
ncbi:MAG: hypothetical protein ACRELF_06580, partial [Gemmataceae bacterium]